MKYDSKFKAIGMKLIDNRKAILIRTSIEMEGQLQQPSRFCNNYGQMRLISEQ